MREYPAAQNISTLPAISVYDGAFRFVYPETSRRDIMAKGQLRSNKETKKPKKDKAAKVPAGTLMGAPKAAPQQKK